MATLKQTLHHRRQVNRPRYPRHPSGSGSDAFRTRPVTGHHSCRVGALGCKTSQYNSKTNYVLANHRRHAEMNLLRNLQLKGSYEK